MEMEKFAWGSSQYDDTADLFRKASKYTFEEAVKRLEVAGFECDIELNDSNVACLAENQIGKLFTGWKNASRDLWYACSMAEEILFNHIEITCEGEEVTCESPVRMALVCLAITVNRLGEEEHFKGFDT